MSDPADLFAPAWAYEEGLVPALMQEWPPRVIDAAALRSGDHVLDVACGTGVLTRAVAERVGPMGGVVGLDINPGMLAVARAKRPDIQWEQGMAEALPFPATTFDAVVSQFGLMFFPDAPRALAEMWRVIKPGGRLALAVWAALDATPAYDLEAGLVERLAGPSASAPLRAPFRLGDPPAFRAVFEAAGIPLTSLTTVTGRGRFPSIRAMVEADVIGWLPLVGVSLPPDIVAAILQEAEQVLAPFRTPDGAMTFPMPANIAVARRP